MVLIEIGNPYGLDKAFANQGLHSAPSFSEVGLSVVDKLERQRQDNINRGVRCFDFFYREQNSALPFLRSPLDV